MLREPAEASCRWVLAHHEALGYLQAAKLQNMKIFNARPAILDT